MGVGPCGVFCVNVCVRVWRGREGGRGGGQGGVGGQERTTATNSDDNTIPIVKNVSSNSKLKSKTQRDFKINRFVFEQKEEIFAATLNHIEIEVRGRVTGQVFLFLEPLRCARHSQDHGRRCTCLSN